MYTQIPLSFQVFKIGFCIMLQKGPRPVVFCGPSGTGKSTLIKLLFDEFPDKFGFSVSHTTRKPRPGEEHGAHYYFTTKEDMQKQINQGDFIETATFSGNLYGTSKQSIEDVQRDGKICVLDIEMEGVKQIKSSSLNPLYIFIKPPSITDLEHRLIGRKTETNDSLQRRLSRAILEMEFGETPGNFDIIIENDNIEKAYKKLKDFILTELNQQKLTEN
ncbi:PREDICTED: guanylate kinase-like isoform X1 [Ceratosolen solmsi marchali]|uniref:guanylate kinase n=2 Tax=Ceratosolen solmsi marchali TaxID=326594 RepID=A0AAJ7DTQ8_9HYME|nr:PREDICTED: guanylate kinase-like isoform X1 [Ceratosolen solmsi marchali]